MSAELCFEAAARVRTMCVVVSEWIDEPVTTEMGRRSLCSRDAVRPTSPWWTGAPAARWDMGLLAICC